MGGTAVAGPFRWNIGFRRERLDVTTFESTVSASGNNLHTDGLTGPLDTTFQVEAYVNDATVNIFFPEAQLVSDLLYRKNVTLGYNGVAADVLEFTPNQAVRDRAMATVQMQSNGLVSPAA